MKKFFDLAYASSSASQKLDLYLPSNPDELHPLILFAHGGAFTFGDKRDNQLTPILRGLDRGFAVASLEYRKAEEARFPAMVYDAKAAVRFLRAHAADYNLDPEQFFGWGPSSGGWLMSMLGVTAGNPAFEDLSMGYSEQRSDLQAVVDWCGPCGNFLQMDKAFLASGAGVADHDQPDSPESRFLGAQITHLPELCRMSAPCSYASETTPPFLIVHGGADQIVPVEQSLTFYRALVAATNDTRHKLHIESGQPHHGASWYNDPWVANMGFSFLEDILTF